ncbi:MAG TPA: DUF5916 domain-containing protein [Thermoanaerobaculaceae bacterium]|nr:DUF5916 domain-containing protein [Thermoanaerobaculaceae bacterium]
MVTIRDLPPGAVLVAAALFPCAALAQPEAPPPIAIRRAAGPIAVDGDLRDAGWKDAARVEQFFETQPRENIPPPVRTVALLTYDGRYLYIGLLCDDPSPSKIRAPYVSRDNVIGTDDNVAVFLDTRGDRRSAMEFRVNPRGQQADAMYDDGSQTEDLSPDFFYDTAARLTPQGWQAEMRIPFSTLRYDRRKPLNWGILVWRNYPRDYRYFIQNAPIPRNSNCLVCHCVSITGLADLPAGGHLIVAPYGTLTEEGASRQGPGTPFLNEPVSGDAGVDTKWMPSASTVLDATINPDFSQIESDVGQIAINKQFAIFYPEKRPFFLEGVDLFNTPIQAVYTRTITSPRWGARATGKIDSSAYTLLVTQDRGGGSVVIPGPTASGFAPQDFSSFVAIGRIRQDFGASFGGLLLTDRENSASEGGGHNRVFGPDFQWRASERDQVTGQILFSDTQTPNRPDLEPSWDGRTLSSRAFSVQWRHTGYHWAWSATYQDFGEDFRADTGFVPQVGYRFEKAVLGYNAYNFGIFSQLTAGPFCIRSTGSDGALIRRTCGLFVNPAGILNLGGELDLVPGERTRIGDTLVESDFTVYYDLSVDPGRVVSRIRLNGFVGDYPDVTNGRPGNGAEIGLTATVKATTHLALDLNADWQWLDVEFAGQSARLFTAEIARLKATYNFTSHTFLRLIGQYFTSEQNPALYLQPVPGVDRSFTGSALFAYAPNWQTVLYLGYGDSRALNEKNELVPTGREFFLKVSYAFQE